ncbi:MAG: carboxypeptidase-like regulatory domain-containing protein [Bacteroidales bacterium]|nr:carboxypeptidase-like regulatory domain-containing protein [Bacteroidales bacterium]
MTLTDGGYTLEKVKPGSYFIRVSFVGYETIGKSVVVGEGDAEVPVDTIYLNETTASIGEVTVVAERLKARRWLTGLYMPFLK